MSKSFMIEAKIRFLEKTRLNKNGIYSLAGVVIFAISVLGLILAVEMVDAINKK